MFSVTKITVRYAETDQMGIVHHSVYPVWFEAGRTDLIKLAGVTYSKVEQRGLLLPLISLSCTYKGYAAYEDEVVVITSLKEQTYTRMVFEYEVRKKDIVITSGTTNHVWTNKALKPVNIKKKAPDLYDAFTKFIEID